MAELSELVSDAALESAKPQRRFTVLWMALSMALVVAAAAVAGYLFVQNRERQVYDALERRLELFAGSRVAVIQTWLDGTVRLSTQLVNNDLFRLFATESDLAAATDPLAAQLSQQAPYMVDALTEFVRQNELRSAYLLGRDGSSRLASGGAPDLGADRAALAREVAEAGQARFAPVRTAGREFELDFYRPVPAMQAENTGTPPRTVGVFLMTVPVTNQVAEFLAPGPFAQPGEHSAIVQRGPGDALHALVPEAAGVAVQPVDPARVPNAAEPLPFAERASVAGGGVVFSVGLPAADMPWLVVQEIDRDAALAPVRATANVVIIVSVLATLLIAGALAATWFFEQSAHNHAIAEQFRDLASRIDAHRRLLAGIAGAIREYIGLKRLDGTYSYVNPAFATALGRPVDQVVGQGDEALFGHGTAQRLALTDQAALRHGDVPPTEEQIYFAGTLRHVEISKVPLIREDGSPDGIVSVARDVTELFEQRRKREAAIRHTIDALVKTVELSDPYLAGHSRLLRGFGGLVARRLDLPGLDVAAVEIAADLSQIGKPIVPRDILTKPERLSPEEIEIMQTHIHHATAVLADVDFDLPVHETIAQMYERLDGSGYPAGLSGDAIHIRARILGVCDVFCARIRPRSYRAAISHELALQILSDHPSKYDAAVVAALAEIIRTTDGEKLLLVADTG